MFFAQSKTAAFLNPNGRTEADRMNDDRRRHKRIALKMSVCCQKVGLSDGRLYSGRTLNVSPGGLLLEMKGTGLRDGELLSVEMSVPATEGLLDFGGSFSSYARVVRAGDTLCGNDPDHAVALEFCESPKLRI
jgi:hypothetical protein